MFLLWTGSTVIGQSAVDQAFATLQSDPEQWHLSATDVSSMRVSSAHLSNQSGLFYVYIQQQFQQIDVYNAQCHMVYDSEGSLVHLENQFIANLTQKAIHPSADKGPEAILRIAAHDLHRDVQVVHRDGGRKSSFKDHYRVPALSEELVSIRKVWMANEAKSLLQLVYILQWIDHMDDEPLVYHVAASTGEILRSESAKLHCTIDPGGHAHCLHEVASSLSTTGPAMAESYRVLPLGVESPAHGQRLLVQNPADSDASPFAWHDLNGVHGPEFTDTRGNNVFAQEDVDANNRGGFRPDGGNELIFDFPIDGSFAEDYQEASVTNLFYWININHDIFHHYGFDEAAGNFQVTNYSGQGKNEDPVVADAQDGGARNNATFFTQEDGIPARIEMHLWGANALQIDIEVTGSSDLPGVLSGIESAFSSQNKLINRGPISGRLVLAMDQTGGSNLACNAAPIQNGGEMEGAIALIDRGTCFFVEKVRNAEALGAKAVIICNNVAGPPIPMGGNDNNITIPAVMITQNDCMLLKQALTNGESLEVNIDRRPSADDFDSSLDNLIITHEFCHGLTLRLTGGSGNPDCLNNQEQMGEGWSDYFGLMLTTDWAEAQARDLRAVSSFLLGQGTDGRGIRDFPYTINRRTNPLRYSNIRTASIPHGVGTVWGTMLWDMTWAIIETEGISTDLYRGDGGNNIAMRIIIEALKLQPCSPGFVDARDAILKADELLYGGAHHFAIWKAFAGRGLGVDATQGHPNNVLDGTSDFALPEAFRTQIDTFIAEDSLSSILLSWNSLREIDHGSFVVERSIDGSRFLPLTEMKGGPTKNFPTSYQFEDRDVAPGRWYYYRLIQRNHAGVDKEMGYDSAFVVPFEQVLLFPNPTSRALNIKLSRKIMGPVSLGLFSMDGKLLWQQSGDAETYYQNQRIDQPSLPPGTYFLEILTSADKITRRVVFYQ